MYINISKVDFGKYYQGGSGGGGVTPEPYLCFTSTGDSTVAMNQYGSPTDISNNKVIQYKLNDGEWQTWDLSGVMLHDGDKMYVKSDDTIPLSENEIIYKQFEIMGTVAASGNIMSLLNFSDTLPSYAFYYLFYNSTLTQAPELPAATLDNWCYNSMFMGCNKLNYVKCLATNTSATNCTKNWLTNVSATGNFYTPAATNWATGSSGIPRGWTRHDV